MGFSILFQDGTNIILTGGVYWPSIVFLHECTGDTLVAHSANHPTYTPESFPIATMDPREYVQWSWNPQKRILVKTDPALITPKVGALSRLMTAKYATVRRMTLNLTEIRYKFSSGVLLQETVYILKRQQAQALRDSAYNEDRLWEFPLVVQYADLRGITIKQAVDDILFRARLDEDGLAKTELLRLRYFTLVKNTTSPEDLPAIEERFLLDCYKPQIT